MAGPGGKEVGRLSLKVLPDTTLFARSLGAYVKRIEKTLVVRLPVTLDGGKALKELGSLKTLVEGLEPKVDIEPELDGQAKTRAAMAALLVSLKAMAARGGPSVSVRFAAIKSTAVVAATAAVKQLSNSIGGIGENSSYVGRSIALWGPLIFVAASAVAAIGPALAALVPLTGGIALAVGAIALGFNQLKPLFEPIRAAFAGMRAEIGAVLSEGLMPLVKAFASTFLPILKIGLIDIAAGLNAATKNFLGFLNSGTGLTLMSDAMSAIGRAMSPLSGLLAPLAEVFLRLSIAAAPALEMMNRAIVRVTTNFANFLASGDRSQAITDSMSMLGDILSTLGQLFKEIFIPLFAAAPAVVAALEGVVDVFGFIMVAMTPVFTWMSENEKVVRIIASAFTGLAIAVAAAVAIGAIVGLIFASTFTIVAAAVGIVIGVVIALYREFEGFRNVVNAVAEVVLGSLITQFKLVAFIAKILWTVIRVVAVGIWNHMKRMGVVIVAVFGVIRTGFRMFQAVAKAVFASVTSFIGARVRMVASILRSVGGATQAVGALFGRMRAAISERMSSAVAVVRGIPGRVRAALSGAGAILRQVGVDMIQGLINGIRSMAGAAAGAAKNAVGGAVGAAKSLLKIGSPSRVFRQIGEWSIEGMIIGLDRQQPSLAAKAAAVVSSAVNAAQTDTPALALGVTTDGLDAYLQKANAFKAALTGGDMFGPEQMELVIRNFESGRAWMRETTNTKFAQESLANIRDNRVGVDA